MAGDPVTAIANLGTEMYRFFAGIAIAFVVLVIVIAVVAIRK